MIPFKLLMLLISVNIYLNVVTEFHLLLTDTVLLKPYLEQQMLILNSQTPLVHFSLGLSDEHKRLLQTLSFNKDGVYNKFDNFSQIISEVTSFLKSLGNCDKVACTTAKIIHDIVTRTLSVLHQESAWVAVRCFKKNDLMTMPRWHTDGEDPVVYAIGCKYKITCTLKGPGTLFCNATAALKNQFYVIQKNPEFNAFTKRQQLYDLLKDSVIETAHPYEATVFLIGDDAAIHSEPDINQDRLYLGILPGTKEQIKKFSGA